MSRMKLALCCMLIASTLLMSGCVSRVLVEKDPIEDKLPEVRSGPEAPIGDSQTSWTSSAVLYVPDATASRLNTAVQTVVIQSGQTKQEAYMEALLRLVNSSDFYSGTQEIRLSPVSNAVETTGDLATVNMHTSMWALSAQEQFALRMAIINTLTELPETNYVNILVNGRDIGLDIGEAIPTGVMARYPGPDITTYWSQMQAQRSSQQGELQRAAALYFVSGDGNYLLGEVRNMTFAEHDVEVYARTLLEELGKGATVLDDTRTLVPAQDWFERDPVHVEIEGDSYVELYFHRSVNDFLKLKGSTPAMMLSSICYTLTGFIPRLEGVIAYIDGELVTELSLMNGEEWAMSSGQITRESVASLAADFCTVYYPLVNGARLRPVLRPIAQRQRTQPRALLRELMKTPTNDDLSPVFPDGVSDADILGLQIQDDTALINLTDSFAQACASMSQVAERNMVYSIVNTLTEIESVKRVRFFVEGTQAPLAGFLFMGGEFMRHPGLIHTGAQ